MTPLPRESGPEAGRELDARIAEEVMGYRRAEAAPPRHYTNPDAPEYHQPTPHYSTRIYDAWLVVEKLSRVGRTIAVVNESCGEHSVCIRDLNRVTDEYEVVAAEEADTAPLAICLAALAVTPTPGGREP